MSIPCAKIPSAPEAQQPKEGCPCQFSRLRHYDCHAAATVVAFLFRCRILQQSQNDMRCAAGTPATGAHINAHTNAHIIFPRTSVTSEMARTPFWRLRTSFACAACHCASAAAARLASKLSQPGLLGS